MVLQEIAGSDDAQIGIESRPGALGIVAQLVPLWLLAQLAELCRDKHVILAIAANAIAVLIKLFKFWIRLRSISGTYLSASWLIDRQRHQLQHAAPDIL